MLRDAPPVRLQRAAQGLVRGCRVAAAEHDDVECREQVGMVTEAFPDEALDAIAGDGAADTLLADGEAQPTCRLRRILRTGVREHREEAVTGAAGASEDAFEVSSLAQPAGAIEADPGARSRAVGGVQALRRARPFALRAFSTRRPAFVAMRARKP